MFDAGLVFADVADAFGDAHFGVFLDDAEFVDFDQFGVAHFLAGNDLGDDHGFFCGDTFHDGGASGFGDDEVGVFYKFGHLISPADDAGVVLVIEFFELWI